MLGWIFGGIAVVLLVFYILYVGVINKKNTVKEALSGVDVQLKKRFDLIPEILTVAKKYIDHEKTLLTRITELRTAVQSGLKDLPVADLKQGIEKASALNAGMGKLFAVMENYPDLKADKPLVKAMEVYQSTEEDLAAARRFYNSAVKDLTNACEIFPSSMVASMLSIAPYPFFEAEEQAKVKVSAADYLK